MSNLIITKQIIYGSVALWLGKRADEKATHKWAVYVRGPNNEDISYFIKDVEFTLHTSFENNVRKVSKFPFELYEAGWGEFDIKITIYFIDESIRPMEFMHLLKLYPTQSHISQSTKKPIVSESLDEIIFVNPSLKLREILNNEPMPQPGGTIGLMAIDDNHSPSSDKSKSEKKISLTQGLEGFHISTQVVSETFQNKFEFLNMGGNTLDDVEMKDGDNADTVMQVDDGGVEDSFVRAFVNF
jgi:transcription initiation factor IIF auxiliary subunit